MKLKALLMNQQGQGMTEYIVLLVLIAIVSIGITKTLGETVQDKIKEANQEIKDKIVIK